jgi:hypothetical protein
VYFCCAKPQCWCHRLVCHRFAHCKMALLNIAAQTSTSDPCVCVAPQQEFHEHNITFGLPLDAAYVQQQAPAGPAPTAEASAISVPAGRQPGPPRAAKRGSGKHRRQRGRRWPPPQAPQLSQQSQHTTLQAPAPQSGAGQPMAHVCGGRTSTPQAQRWRHAAACACSLQAAA